MKKILLSLFVFAAIFAVYWFKFRTTESTPEGPKQAPLALKKHSELFNNQVDSIVNAYMAIKNAFVESDTATVKTSANNFITLLDKLPIDELKKDTASIFETIKGNLMDIKSNAEFLVKQSDITEMRRDFKMVTEMMYPSFFTAINYEGQKLYVANCPMAFNDTEEANWISNSAEIVNPYLGKKHPKYQAGMLNCGSVKDSIQAK